MNREDNPTWDDIKAARWQEKLKVVGLLLLVFVMAIPGMLFILLTIRQKVIDTSTFKNE